MARLLLWQLILALALTLPLISRHHAILFVRAQDVGTVSAATTAPIATAAAAPDVTEAAVVDTAAPPAPAAPVDAVPVVDTVAPVDTAAPVATTPQATTVIPEATASAVPATTEAVTPPVPTATIAATPAVELTTAPVDTVAPTTPTPVSIQTASTVSSGSSEANWQKDASSSSSLRGSETGSSAAQSETSISSGTLGGLSTTKTIVICAVGGVGIVVIVGLLLLLWKQRTHEDQELGTPLPPDVTTGTFPNNSAASIVTSAAIAQDYSVWKASGASFGSRDLPLTESTRAKLNATTRSSMEYDLTERPSQIADVSTRGAAFPIQEQRETNASSEQRFSIREVSDFSMLHEGDSESSAMAFDRYSASSRLSSDTGRSNSGWGLSQVPKNLEMHRFSSMSSTTSSIVARNHKPVSFVNHDLTDTSSTGAATESDSTRSRVDVPDWYSVIESPTDNDRYTGERYTGSSLDSDNISSERESFEL